MKKTNVLWIILGMIFLAIFNTIFFTSGSVEYNTSIWISYGFIHFSYLMLLFTSKLIRSGKSSAVFGFSLYSISATYFLVEFAIGITFIRISSENYNVALLVQLCLAGLYFIILISNMIANEHTANAEENRQYQIAYVKEASAKLRSLLEHMGDKKMKKNIERVYDAIFSSPIKSHQELAKMENNILLSIDKLEHLVEAENREGVMSEANSLLFSINERNNILKSIH